MEQQQQQVGETEPKRVVALAVDASSHSETALDFYLAHVYQEGDFLVLIHCPEACDFSDAPNAHTAEKLLQNKAQDVLNLEKKFLETLRERNGEVKGKFRTHGGKPGEVVCRIAAEEGAALILCGTRGMGMIRRTIMGSVSDYIVHHSHVPVLVCRFKHSK